MDNYDEDALSDLRVNTRLYERRKGISNKKKIKPDKSTIYCNKCLVPNMLIVCPMCKDNICQDCFNGRDVCIPCFRIRKHNKKIHPSNNEIRNSEYVNNTFINKYILCCINSNKK